VVILAAGFLTAVHARVHGHHARWHFLVTDHLPGAVQLVLQASTPGVLSSRLSIRRSRRCTSNRVRMREGLVLMIQSDSFEQAVFNVQIKQNPAQGRGFGVTDAEPDTTTAG